MAVNDEALRETPAVARPTGRLTVVGAVPQGEPNKIAAYAVVEVVDELGKSWFFKAAAFGHAMKPEPPGKIE